MYLGLILEDVQACAGDPTLRESLHEGGLVDYGSAGGVDQIRGLLHAPERLCTDEMPSLRQKRGVNGDEVRLAEQSGEIGARGAELALRRGIGGDRVLVEHAHSEALSPPGHRAPDAAEAHDAQRLAMDVAAVEQHVLPLREAAVANVAVSL